MATQNIIIACSRNRPADNVVEADILDQHAVGWRARWPAVQVVLLHDDSVLLDVGQQDVGVRHIDYAARTIKVGLDP